MQRGSALVRHLEQLDRCENSISGGAVIGEDDVPRLLATQLGFLDEHCLCHVTIAYRRAHHVDPIFGQCVFQTHVAHHSGYYNCRVERSFLLHVQRGDSHHAVTVDRLSTGGNEENAIAVTVERDTEIGVLSEDRFAQCLKVCRSAFAVDAPAIWSAMHLDDVRVEVTQDMRCDCPRSAVCAIDDDRQAGEIDIFCLDRPREKSGVAGACRLQRRDRSDMQSSGREVFEGAFYCIFLFNGELHSFVVEELDPVILRFVV